MIADTTFLIDIIAKEPSALRKAARIEQAGSSISVGTPSIFELYVGASLSRRAEEEKSRILSVLASLPQLPLDFDSAQAGDLIYGEKLRAGIKIDPEDAMLAGIAKTNAEVIITRNIKHFTGISKVSVEQY